MIARLSKDLSSEETLNVVRCYSHPAKSLIQCIFRKRRLYRSKKAEDQCPNIGTAIVGHEGMVGWSALTGRTSSTHNAITQMRSGTVLSISVSDITAACAISKTLLMTVMRFIEIIMAQMGQAIVSHLREPVDRRVCRWLLMRHDRIPSDHLLVKHEEIAANLGVRRASVTDCLHVLEGEHFVKCFRGRIIITDRKGVEDRAGDSYGIAENHYRALIGPFGRVCSTDTSKKLSNTHCMLDVRSSVIILMVAGLINKKVTTACRPPLY